MGGYVYRCSQVVDILRDLFPRLSVNQRESLDIPNPIDAYAQDMTRARQELGYEPAFDLEDGIHDWLKTREALERQYRAASEKFEVEPLP